MKKLIILIALLALVGVAGWGQGNTSKTGQWLHDCWQAFERTVDNRDSGADTAKAGMLMGFVWGASQVEHRKDTSLLAIPDGVISGQMITVVGNYLDAHPERWNEPAGVLVIDALRAVWPYKK